MSNFPSSASVHGGKDESGVPLKGVSGAEFGEFKVINLVEIVVLIKFIFDRKKFENVLHSFWFYSSVLVWSRSAECRTSLAIFHLFAAGSGSGSGTGNVVLAVAVVVVLVLWYWQWQW